MKKSVTGPEASIDTSTVYVMPDPAGLGATVDRALDQHPEARHVAICGDRIGGKATTAEWAGRLGRWSIAGVPHIERHDLRCRVTSGGAGPVQVSRVEQWFGQGIEPEAARDAMRIVRGVVAEYGTRPIAHPAITGRRMLAEHWSRYGQEWPSCPPEVAELLRETSGQGRFEVMPAAAPDGVYPAIYYVDARFQYAACAMTELPVGEPVEHIGELPDPYAPSWCRVRWEPAEGLPVGLLPYHLDGKRWTWPTEGKWSGWVSGAEVHLARMHGYRVEVERSIVWPSRARPLDAWARHLARHRDRIEALPVSAASRAAARNALRAILVACIGSMHSYTGGRPVVETQRDGQSRGPVADEAPGLSPFSRPEWSTAIWSLARTRLARVMLDQRAPVLGTTLDGFYVGGAPVLADDDGRPGVFRLVGSTQWAEPIRTLPELYEMGATIEPVRIAA